MIEEEADDAEVKGRRKKEELRKDKLKKDEIKKGSSLLFVIRRLLANDGCLPGFCGANT